MTAFVTPSGSVGKFNQAILASLVQVDDLIEDPQNARLHGDENLEALRTSLDLFGQVKPIVYWISPSGQKIVIAGNGTYRSTKALGWSHVAAVPFSGDEREARAFAIADNRTAELAQWDVGVLQTQLQSLSVEWQADGIEWQPQTVGFTPVALDQIVKESNRVSKDKDGLSNREREEQRVEEASALPEGPEVQAGDMWLLGEHRLLCGDSLDAETVTRLMNGERAPLLHADPPYGMSKEGVQNDHLRREKLDAFQLAWWNACRPHLTDNGSAYIWGNAPELWRLWYRHLDTDTALSIRNEIVWDKGSAPGQSSDDMRGLAITTERCLFLMLGTQEFSTDSDDHWEGWEPLRLALVEELQKTPWTQKEIATITGVTPRMFSHWFGRSQWAFIPEEKYLLLSKAGKEFDAFQFPYDGVRAIYERLKKDFNQKKEAFYASRSFFDNTHDNMGEVWCYPRVSGAERWGHSTPKPVAMIERVLKSSAPVGAIVLEPFIGSGTTLIAAEQTGRRCFGIEIDPAYVSTTIARWEQLTGQKAVKES